MSTELSVIQPQRQEPTDLTFATRELENQFALAVRQRELLEDYIKKRLQPKKHFYRAGNSEKDSLTKEGAELICLPHGLKPKYILLAGPDQPPENDSPYQLVMLCRLMKGEQFGGEGIGSASSHHTTRAGDRVPRQKDIGLRHNATLKMAEKSAFIAATLNATAASEFFTQDMEEEGAGSDTPARPSQPQGTPSFMCPEHKVLWFKSKNMKHWAHPIKGTKDASGKEQWCNAPQDIATRHTAPAVVEGQARDISDDLFGPEEQAENATHSASAPAAVSQQGATPQTAIPEPPIVDNLGALFTYGRSLGYPGRVEMFAALGVKHESEIKNFQAAAQKLHDLKAQG